MSNGVSSVCSGCRHCNLHTCVSYPRSAMSTDTTQGGGGRIISWERFVFKEGGEIFPDELGTLAVQCVREAV